MCNINVFVRKDGRDVGKDKRLLLVANTLTAISYESNDDAEGFFSIDDDGVLRCIERRINKVKYDGRVKGCILATHQRFTTSGNNRFMTHPHKKSDLYLLHNGVFDNLGNGDKSDTREYIEMLAEKMDGGKKSIASALDNVHKKISGYYSCVLYSNKDRRLYYYKEDTSKMFMVEDNKYLVMSTKESNLTYAKSFLGIRGRIKKIKPFALYSLDENGLRKVCNLKKGRIRTWTNYYGSTYPKTSGYQDATIPRPRYDKGTLYTDSYGYKWDGQGNCVDDVGVGGGSIPKTLDEVRSEER